jgi:hypothetical protein
MVTTIDISGGRRVGVARATRAEEEHLRYRLDVVAVSAVDVVRSTGGWLYDRVMAGWEVTVLLSPGADTRPLRILGVDVLDLDSESAAAALERKSESLAVSAAAFAADAEVRQQLLRALDDRLTQVTVWGDGWPLRVDRGMIRVQHVLSAAARAFKVQALAAAGIACQSVDPIEALLCDSAALSSVESELIRLG